MSLRTVLGSAFAVTVGAWLSHGSSSPFHRTPGLDTARCDGVPVPVAGASASEGGPRTQSTPTPAFMGPASGEAAQTGPLLGRVPVPPQSAVSPKEFLFGFVKPSTSALVRSVAHCSDFIDRRCSSALTQGTADDKVQLVNQWLVETSDFLSVATVESLVKQGKAVLQIMRLADMYVPVPVSSSSSPASPTGATDDATGSGPAASSAAVAGNPAPVMRLVGFFPGATTSQVFRELTEVDKRLSWDSNYMMFEKLPKPVSGNPEAAAATEENSGCYSLDDVSVRRDMLAVAPRFTRCVGDSCKLFFNARSELLEQDWLCHKVGSSFFSRFGVSPRFFRYERVGYVHHLMDVKMPPTPEPNGSSSGGAGDVSPELADTIRRAVVADTAVYDILYCGSRQGVKEATAASSALKAFLLGAEHTVHAREGNRSVVKGDADAKVPLVPVDVNYQHIVLVPIANYRRQLLQSPETNGSSVTSSAFLAMANSGSMRDRKATETVYNMLTATAQLRVEAELASSATPDGNPDNRKEWGTLLVMTSANDASVPSSLPTWVQQKISSVVSHQAYSELTEALKRDFPS